MLAQNPAQTFLAHSNLDIDAFTGVATSELGTPHDNLAILEELGNHFKGLVFEELRELVQQSRGFDWEPRTKGR